MRSGRGPLKVSPNYPGKILSLGFRSVDSFRDARKSPFKEETLSMAAKRSIYSNLRRRVLLQSVVPITAAVLMPTVFAQQAIVVKNWPMSASSAPSTWLLGVAPAWYLSPSRRAVSWIRADRRLGQTGAFGAPSLVAGQARGFPFLPPIAACRRRSLTP